MLELLEYGFVWRGLCAGTLVAAACAVLGVFLVLKRLSLIGDGLSHVCLTGVSLGLLTGISPLYMSMPVVLGAGWGILKLMKKFKIYGDAAIGIVSAAGLAAGLLITAFAGGFNADLLGFLFGSILTVNAEEVLFSVLLFVVWFGFLFWCYGPLTAASFDEPFAKTRGIKTESINRALALFTAAAVVLALKVVGIFLISAFVIIPPVAALQVARTFKQTLYLSALLGMGAVWGGVGASCLWDIPSGAAIIVFNLILLAACYAWGQWSKRAY